MAKQSKELPTAQQPEKELPQVGSPENTIIIGEKLIEIKPTKLRYQRNRTAAFYKMLELYPLADILAMEAGAFGDDRDGDKAVMDWLIAVFDDEALVLENYDSMDTGTVEQQIFQELRRLEGLRADHRVFDNDADTWLLDTADIGVLGIGRYCRGEKLLALFNFAEGDRCISLRARRSVDHQYLHVDSSRFDYELSVSFSGFSG